MTRQPISRSLDRFLEVLAVLLLGIATVGTAWCALQSQLWSGESDRISNVAATEHAEANRLYGLATQTIAYDATTVASYALAVASDQTSLQEFYRTSLVRRGFLDHLNSWEAQIKAGSAPENLLDNKAYLDQVLGPFRTVQDQADSDARAGEDAGRVGDLYTLATVLLAASLFFAGVTASFRSPSLRVALLTACLVTIVISAARLADLPIAPATWGMLVSG
ncbi:MAG: hypothetical protein WCF12_02370 [Propionicimonas sp.]